MILIAIDFVNFFIHNIVIDNILRLFIKWQISSNCPMNLFEKILFEIWMKDDTPLSHLLHQCKCIMGIVCFKMIFH